MNIFSLRLDIFKVKYYFSFAQVHLCSGGIGHIVILKCLKLFLWFGIQMFDHILLTTF